MTEFLLTFLAIWNCVLVVLAWHYLENKIIEVGKIVKKSEKQEVRLNVVENE